MDIFIPLIFLLTTALVFYFAIKKPYLTIGKHHIETYALVAMAGPVIFILTRNLYFSDFLSLTKGSTNPITILVFFLAMVFISIYLDEIGFMEYCARLALKYSGKSARKLFIILYAVVSILTIFTSNDIIILTLTPFIYYFTKHANLDPKPYLLAEFFAANTWSILLEIGNPTNIYITTNYAINFFEYFKVMLLSTIVAGLLNLSILYLIFRKSLDSDFRPDRTDPEKALQDKTGAIIGVSILAICTILLAFSDKINIPMWKIAIVSAIVLLVIIIIRSINDSSTKKVSHLVHRIPWSIIPFVISFFLMAEVIFKHNILSEVAGMIIGFTGSTSSTVMFMGITSAIFSNILNNIPMTVIFTQLIHYLPDKVINAAVYSTTIGSNIGAYFTPFGALAGIMWMNILKHKKVNLGYGEFIRYGLIAGGIALLGALIALTFMLR